MISARPVTAAMGMPAAQGFRHGDHIGLNPEMFRGEPLAGAGEARLYFVRDEENAVLAADVLQQLEVAGRGNDEAAFAENRLGNDGGDGFGSHGTLEGIFQIMGEGFRRGSFFTTVRIRERNTVDVAGKGLEARFVGMRLAGERHGEKSPAMEGVFKTNDSGALGVGPGDFDGVFDGLGAGVDEDGFLRKIAGSQRVQFFPQRQRSSHTV